MKKVDLIGVQMDFGAGTRGVNMGPAAIRFAGLVKGINGLGLECLDKGDLIPPQTGKSSEKLRNYEQVNYINKKLFTKQFYCFTCLHTILLCESIHLYVLVSV